MASWGICFQASLVEGFLCSGSAALKLLPFDGHGPDFLGRERPTFSQISSIVRNNNESNGANITLNISC